MGLSQMICSTFWLPKTATLSDYQAAAVLASDACYRDDVARILTAQGETYRQQGLTSAAYGLALGESLALLGQ